jgi:hypothetical protein
MADSDDAVGLLWARYREIWSGDFEYFIGPDFRPRPWCGVFRELKGGQEIRMWRDELYACRRAPFDVGPDCLFVSYQISAEMDCFLILGWEFPRNVICLYAEYLALTNKSSEGERKLLHALAHFGFPHLMIEEKKEWQHKAATQTHWSAEEQKGLLDYCATDVDAVQVLLPAMVSHIELPYAALRGRYMQAVSRITDVSIPIDVALHREMTEAEDAIKLHFIQLDGGPFQCYEHTSFRDQLLIQNYLNPRGIYWPVTTQGRLEHKREVWKERARAHPELEPLRRLRSNITEIRLNDLTIGSDGRNRVWLKPFWTATGRNMPSAKEYIYALPGWLRGLIRPEENTGLAYLDFKSQELVIMAALSQDQGLIDGVLEGDPYLFFAREANLRAPNSSPDSLREFRDKTLKPLMLGQLFGMSPYGIQAALNISLMEARELYARHKAVHATFHRWCDDMAVSAQFAGRMDTVFGWPQRVDQNVGKRTIINFFAQANGAEMLRLALIAATEAGLKIAAPLHDALLLQAPLGELDDAIVSMQQIMRRAGLAVTGGLPVDVHVEHVVRWPDRYPSRQRGGRDTWGTVLKVLQDLGRRTA